MRLWRAVADLDAEKLDLHVFRHDGGGIDDDERSVGARRERVNGAGGELLAAAGGADDQHPAIGRPDFLHDLPELIHRRRSSDQRRGQRTELLELTHLALEPRILQGAFGNEQQPVGLERLFDEIVGATLDRRHCGLDIAVARDHYHRQLGMVLLERVEQLQAVEAAALQPNVEENEIGPARNHRAERLVGIGGRARTVAFVLQNAGDQLADIRFIVHNEDIGWHC